MINQEKIIERVLNELKDILQKSIRSKDSVLGVEEVDEDAMTITIKFKYQIVESDNYIGLCEY